MRIIVQLRKLDKQLEKAMDAVSTFWRKEVAKEMLVEGEPLDRITKYTELSIEEIENL